MSKEENFPLIENDEILVKDDIFKILEESGVGVPAYYTIEFEVDGKRVNILCRSGCFPYLPTKIKWIWLYEQHPDLIKAMEYEKDGYTWSQKESLKI